MAVCCLCSIGCVGHRANQVTLTVHERSLGKMLPGEDADTLKISADSNHVAYVIQQGNKQCMVEDGKSGPAYDRIMSYSPVFSPDSRHVAYSAVLDGDSLVVMDGKPGAAYDEVWSDIIFSPNSQHVAYDVFQGHKRLIIVDGNPGHAYDDILDNTLIFSPDSRHVAFSAEHGKNWFVVVDGKPSPAYDGVLKGSRLVFDSPTTLHTLALRNNMVYRVELTIMEKQ